MAQLVKKIKITTTIELLTGLHIGGSKESVEIGGIDLPVIKLATKENQPYIPGSSLKGKMRCLLEQANGIVQHGDIGKDNGSIRNLFGFTEGNKNAQPSRLIVRDAMLTPESKVLLEESDNLDMPFTENKFENTIDRVKGTAGNPRQIERVPAGAEFNAEFVINVWGDLQEEQALVKTFKDGIAMIINDYIGGSGSRGYGQIAFKNWKAIQFEGPDWTEEKAYELGEI
ncbi:MAG: type III-A CRISPR-associated RAMP protein Csm3 [Bacteroidaceae bacterium]|nr:type III-A CRISPR-associated RAMP protein Csm3 [Bacteroidaceae bacterium]